MSDSGRIEPPIRLYSGLPVHPLAEEKERTRGGRIKRTLDPSIVGSGTKTSIFLTLQLES